MRWPISKGQSSPSQSVIKHWPYKCLLVGVTLECSFLILKGCQSERRTEKGTSGFEGEQGTWNLCEEPGKGWRDGSAGHRRGNFQVFSTVSEDTSVTRPTPSILRGPWGQGPCWFCPQLLGILLHIASCRHCQWPTHNAEATANSTLCIFFIFILIKNFSSDLFIKVSFFSLL